MEKTWSFWFKGCKPAGKGGAGKGKWDGSCGTKAYTFDTAEDFWCLYNNIKRASQIPDRSDYYLFIDGIEPKYEDEKNRGGGEWRIALPRPRGGGGNGGEHPLRRFMDDWFLYTMLGCIGETLDENQDVINGVAVSIRPREDRIAIWTRTSDVEKVTQVGTNLRKLLVHAHLEDKVGIKFTSYENLEKGHGSASVSA